MDEFSNRPTVTIHRGLFAFALVTALMSGCEQLGLGKSNSNPVVPAPPERKVPTDSQATSGEASSSPSVKLDGSASGSDSVAAPNAPGIAASQTLAAAVAQGNAATSPTSPPITDPALASDSEEAATDADDEPVDTANAGRTTGPRESAKPGKIIQVGDRGKAGNLRSETVADTGNDVISRSRPRGRRPGFELQTSPRRSMGSRSSPKTSCGGFPMGLSSNLPSPRKPWPKARFRLRLSEKFVTPARRSICC
jgi:hypothetical protein